jgi:hypothetical protein
VSEGALQVAFQPYQTDSPELDVERGLWVSGKGLGVVQDRLSFFERPLPSYGVSFDREQRRTVHSVFGKLRVSFKGAYDPLDTLVLVIDDCGQASEAEASPIL